MIAPAELRRPFEAHALELEPRLEERVWGGNGLARYGKRVPAGKLVGESWEISDVPGKASVVSRGGYRGQSLRELMAAHAEAICGATHGPPRRPDGGLQFPLLLKLLDARQSLSVQVHPSDADLERGGLEGSGKTEAWVILEADPGARIVHGLAPGIERVSVLARLEALQGRVLPGRELESIFRWLPVERGDVIFVPAGTIHAVGGGILLLEVQQTSDITYRIYDHGRPGADGKPRDLHLREAREVADPPAVPCPFARVPRGLAEGGAAGGILPLVSCDKFRVEAVTLGGGAAGPARLTTREKGASSFQVLAGFEGSAVYRGPGGGELEIRPGVFTLLPAALGEYTLAAGSGEATVLRFLGPA